MSDPPIRVFSRSDAFTHLGEATPQLSTIIWRHAAIAARSISPVKAALIAGFHRGAATESVMSRLLSDLQELLTLVGERTSERRRELLRRLTDAYVSEPVAFDDRQTAVLGDILSTLAREMETDVRRTLATRIAELPVAPRGLVVELANDEIAVSGPILKDSLVLTDEDLIALSRILSQEHLGAIARRARVSSVVSEAVAQRADDNVLIHLAQNPGADLPRSALEIMISRVDASEALAELLVHHPQLPPDLLNGLYFIVSTSLRRVIIDRTSDLDPAVVEAAIRESEQRVRARARSVIGVSLVTEDTTREAPTEAGLVQLAREARLRELAVMLGKIAELPVQTAQRLLEDDDSVGLAIVCRACRLQLPTFVALAKARRPHDAITPLIAVYQKMPAEAAGRVVRFWRVRQAAVSRAA